MSHPYEIDVDGREVIIGGGVHAAIYAATRQQLGKANPIVLERNTALGGVFARLKPFMLNSANDASVDSIANGPSRIPARSLEDSINYLPNCYYQIDRSGEYPMSPVVAKTVQSVLDSSADVYTGITAYMNSGLVYTDKDLTNSLRGVPSRIILATGLSMPRSYTSSHVDTGESFLQRSLLPYGRNSIAVVGGGDTACICIERLLGMVPGDFGISKPTRIDWYSGVYSFPLTKKAWARQYHARYIALARHMPQNGKLGVIKPLQARGRIREAGDFVSVNGLRYDHVIDATGYQRDNSAYPDARSICRVDGLSVARWNEDNVFAVGPGLDIPRPSDYGERPYPSSFKSADDAFFRLGPLTAALAASLP